MKDERKSYIMYFTLEKMCAGMNDSDYAALMHAVANYALTGDDNVQLSDVGTAIFTYFKEMHDLDEERWQEKRRMRAEVGKKGGIESGKSRSKHSGEQDENAKSKQNEANEAVNVNGNVNANVNGNANVNVNENVNVNDNVNVNVNENVHGGGEAACNAVPTLTDVQRYFSQKDIRIAAEIFYDMNAKNGWRIHGAPIRDWKAAALRWAEKEKASGSREPPSYNINTAAIDALTVPKLVKRRQR